MTTTRGIWIGTVGLLAIGILVRCWQLFAIPFWLDEAYSAYAAGKGLAFLWGVVPSYETHPPFYYTFLWAWEKPFGDSLISLRATSLFASLATLPVLASIGAAIARLLGWSRERAALLMLAAFGFGCVGIGLVEMAREVRPYALMILTYAVAIRALVSILARRRVGLPLAGRAYAAYLGCALLLLWLHNLGALWAAALGLAFLIAIAGRALTTRDLGWLIGGHALVAIAWAPGLVILIDQAPTWISDTWVRFSWGSVWPRLGVIYAVPDWQAVAALPLAGLAVTSLWRSAGGRRLAAMLLVLALLPVILSITLTLTIAPVFITRTMTPACAPALLLYAIGAVAWGRPIGWIGAGAALFLGANMATVDMRYRLEGPPQDWYRTIAWLQLRFRPGDQIFAYPNEGALPLARALKDKGLDWPIRPIPTAVPAIGWGDWHPTGNRGVVSLTRPVLHTIATQPETRAVPTIWLMRLGKEAYDPGDMFLDELRPGRRVVRTWLSGPISVVGLEKVPAKARPTP